MEIRILEADSYRLRDEDPARRRGIALRAIETLGDEATELDLCRRAIKAIAEDAGIPFAMVYLVSADRQSAQLAGAAGLDEGTRWTPRFVDFDRGTGWPLEHVATTGESARLEQLATRFGPCPRGVAGDARVAHVLPVRGRAGEPVRAILVVGALDEEPAAAAFLRAAADRISAALARSRLRAAAPPRRGFAQPVLPGF